MLLQRSAKGARPLKSDVVPAKDRIITEDS